MDRRELLLGAAALAAATAAGRAIAHENHEGMDSAKSESHHDHAHKSSRNQKLINAAADCIV